MLTPRNAAKIIEATGLRRRVSSRTLASDINAATQDLRWASEPSTAPGAPLLGRINDALVHVAAVKALLSSDKGCVTLGFYPGTAPREALRAMVALEKRLRTRLDRFSEHFSSLEQGHPEQGRAGDRRSAEAVLVCEALPAIFDRLFGRVVRGDRAGAKDRFIDAACEALGLKQRRPEAVKKMRARSRAAAKSDASRET